MKVMLVDDEWDVINGLKTMLNWDRLGVETIISATDGRMAWALFQEHEPDIVMTDVYMPHMNGLELIQHMRAAGSKAPVIIFSGYDDFRFAKEAIRFQVYRYVLKPAVYTEIENILGELIREQQLAKRKAAWYEQFEQHMRLHLPVLREQALYDMITIGLRPGDLPDTKLGFLDLDERIFNGGLVMSLNIYRPENNEKTRLERDWQLYKFAASNIVREIVDKHGMGYILRYNNDCLPILVIGGEEREVVGRAEQIALEAIDSIDNFLDIQSNAGIGSWVERMTLFPISFRESTQALRSGDYDGTGKLFRMDRGYSSSSEEGSRFPAEQIDMLVHAVCGLDRSEVSLIWSNFKRQSLQVRNMSELHSICMGIVISVALKMMSMNQGAIETEETINGLKHIEQIKSRDDVIEWVESYLFQILSKVEEKMGGSGSKSYVDSVIRIVHQRYHENLSFKEIARQMHLSRHYLSNLFKRHTGQTFMNYLSHYRIKKAQELLSTQQYMIYEVSEMVGYSEPSYFGRVFKNIVGISPSEYLTGLYQVRDSHRQ